MTSGAGVVSSFRRLTDSWDPRLEDTMRNAVFAIVSIGGRIGALRLASLIEHRLRGDQQLFVVATGDHHYEQAGFTALLE